MSAPVVIPHVKPPLDEIHRPSWHLRVDGVRSVVVVRCGLCGKKYELDHDVDAAGNVFPSLLCPNAVCGWHVTAQLQGWVP